MADTHPLIMNRFESGLLATMPRARPDAAFVLSYGDGRMRTFARAPGFADRAGSKWCYVVDKSQRFSSGELRIPARGSVYYFSTWFDAAWQVTDPEAVVRANLEVGEPVVSGFLKSTLWPLGRRFDPDDAQQVEEAAARMLQPPLPVGSGLTLNGLTVRLSIDTRQADSVTAVDEDTRRRDLVRARVEELRRLVGNHDPLLVLHLAEHPSDTGATLELINQSRQQDAQNRLALLDRLLASDIITEADGDLLRPMLLGGSTPAIGAGATPALAPAASSGGRWAVPVLSSGPPVPPALPPTPGSASPGPTPPPAPTPPAQAAPAAVVVPPPRPDPRGPRDQPRGTRGGTSAGTPEAGPRDQPRGARPDPVPDGSAPAPSGGSNGVVRWKPLKRPPAK
jgi:hypothetical protein